MRSATDAPAASARPASSSRDCSASIRLDGPATRPIKAARSAVEGEGVRRSTIARVPPRILAYGRLGPGARGSVSDPTTIRLVTIQLSYAWERTEEFVATGSRKTKKPARPRVPLPRQTGGVHEDKTRRPWRQRKHRKRNDDEGDSR